MGSVPAQYVGTRSQARDGQLNFTAGMTHTRPTTTVCLVVAMATQADAYHPDGDTDMHILPHLSCSMSCTHASLTLPAILHSQRWLRSLPEVASVFPCLRLRCQLSGLGAYLPSTILCSFARYCSSSKHWWNPGPGLKQPTRPICQVRC